MSTTKNRDEFSIGGFACKPRSITLRMTAALVILILARLRFFGAGS
jgi:hypothetical protein